MPDPTKTPIKTAGEFVTYLRELTSDAVLIQRSEGRYFLFGGSGRDYGDGLFERAHNGGVFDVPGLSIPFPHSPGGIILELSKWLERRGEVVFDKHDKCTLSALADAFESAGKVNGTREPDQTFDDELDDTDRVILKGLADANRSIGIAALIDSWMEIDQRRDSKTIRKRLPKLEQADYISIARKGTVFKSMKITTTGRARLVSMPNIPV